MAAHRAQHRRRPSRRHQITTRAVSSLVVCGVAVVGCYLVLGARSHGLEAVSSVANSKLAAAPSPLPPNQDPFASPQITSYLQGRSGEITAALYNVTTGETYTYHPGVAQATASMVKIDILAALLYKTQNQHRSLTPQESKAVTAMIEASDNDAASSLFDEVGQMPGLASFNSTIGMSETVGNWGWGLTKTTPVDQLSLLKTIVLPNSVLAPSSQSYEQNLMEHVYDNERFGVAQGPPSSARVGLKNGWYNEPTTGWQINSAGYVQLGSTFYFLVIETAHNPGQIYGEQTTSGLSSLIWSFESQPPGTETHGPTLNAVATQVP